MLLVVLILLLIRKQWMWLFLTLGSTLLWIPGLVVAFAVLQGTEWSVRALPRFGVLLYFWMLPSAMLYYSVKTKDRLLLVASLLSLLMNLGYISFCITAYRACALGARSRSGADRSIKKGPDQPIRSLFRKVFRRRYFFAVSAFFSASHIFATSL